jgi:GWxTD domain-containing protein
MRRSFAACTVAVLIGLVTGYARPEAARNRATGPGPTFHAQIGQRLSTSEDSLRLFVVVSVVYDNLIFLRADTGFAASVELVTSVFKEDDGLAAERIENIRVETVTFAETNSRAKSAVHSEEFLVPPGKYNVRITMTNESEPKRKSRWEGKITLARSNPALRVSDIYWLQEDTTLAATGAPRVVENFYSNEDSSHARVQLYSNGSEAIHIHWYLVREEGDTVQSFESNMTPTGDVQVADFGIALKDLTPDTYILHFLATGNGRHEERTRTFGLRLPGIPPTIKNLEEAIRQLKYIATSAEYKRLRQAPPRERQQAFRDFWKKRDPTPNTEQNELMDEYYLRVQYANENFSANRDGWETDRGRIYIVYGPPTDIERHPFEADSRPYEVWYYTQLARRFVFVDYTGFGDYTLVGPDTGY